VNHLFTVSCNIILEVKIFFHEGVWHHDIFQVDRYTTRHTSLLDML